MTEHLLTRLRAERDNLSLDALAERAKREGVRLTAEALSAWETGKTKRPRRENVAAIDKALDAGGRLLEFYGYNAADARVTELLAEALKQVTTLQTAVQALDAQLAALQSRVDELER